MAYRILYDGVFSGIIKDGGKVDNEIVFSGLYDARKHLVKYLEHRADEFQ